jgi:hypothetical protein
MKKMMKKIKEIRRNIFYKWHWFWWSIHLKWLINDYGDQLRKGMYDAINELLKREIEPIADIDFSVEELVDDLIVAGCCKWSWASDNNMIVRMTNGEKNISKNE